MLSINFYVLFFILELMGRHQKFFMLRINKFCLLIVVDFDDCVFSYLNVDQKVLNTCCMPCGYIIEIVIGNNGML